MRGGKRNSRATSPAHPSPLNASSGNPKARRTVATASLTAESDSCCPTWAQEPPLNVSSDEPGRIRTARAPRSIGSRATRGAPLRSSAAERRSGSRGSSSAIQPPADGGGGTASAGPLSRQPAGGGTDRDGDGDTGGARGWLGESIRVMVTPATRRVPPSSSSALPPAGNRLPWTQVPPSAPRSWTSSPLGSRTSSQWRLSTASLGSKWLTSTSGTEPPGRLRPRTIG